MHFKNWTKLKNRLKKWENKKFDEIENWRKIEKNKSEKKFLRKDLIYPNYQTFKNSQNYALKIINLKFSKKKN